MEKNRLEQQKQFILEIDKEKQILRQTHLTEHGRRENDAEHAWHMAVMAYLLREYSNHEIDIAKTMIMCLIHDIVEIDAGDTYAYDEVAKESQKEREEAAKNRIFSLLPEDQKMDLSSIFDEFEEGKTPEAQFARAMDNFQPLLLNDSNDGDDWVSHGVRLSQILNRQEKTRPGSLDIYKESIHIVDKNVAKGTIIDDREKS